MMSIPKGFVFEPTDEVLIGSYLYPKVMGFDLPWDGIIYRDLYGGEGVEPWNVFTDADNWQTKKENGATKKTIYVFTKVIKAGAPNSQRNLRTAGCGTWKAQTGRKDIERSDTGEIIGCMSMLSFKCLNASKHLGHWIMHEYSLTDAGLTATGKANTDLVLCKITKSIKKASETDPETAQLSIPATKGKRGGEEIEQEGCKKQKCSGEGFLQAEMGDFNLDDIDLDSIDFTLSSLDLDSLF